ncbi:MAG: cytochrome c biogenesis protein CcsA [Planctomycetota bacterium]
MPPLAEILSLSGFESGLLYVAVTVFVGATVVGFGVLRGERRGKPLVTMTAVGAGALTVLVIVMAVRQGSLLLAQRHETLLVAAWLLALGAFVVTRREKTIVVGAIAAPAIGLLTLFALLLAPSASGTPVDPKIGKIIHISLAILGISAFAFAAGVGVLYLWQIRVLKSDPSAAVARRGTPLEVLDRVNFAAAAIGFPLLAMSTLGGWLFLSRELDPGWWLDPTVLATLSGMAVYVVLFSARAFLGWYGRRIAWLTLFGFLVISVGYVVASFCTSDKVIHG